MNYEFRFGGIDRLYGKGSLEKLKTAHVCVIGIGGVGSWAVEALVRSGVGELTLVDLDEVCESNTNRQIHALEGSYGTFKVDAIGKRALLINPECKVNKIYDFFTKDTANIVLNQQFSYVFDGIDSLSHKLTLASMCTKNNIPLIVSGGAGGKSDPTTVRVDDLGKSHHDNLLYRMRKLLKRDYGFPKGKTELGIQCIYSIERAKFLQEDGQVCFSKNHKESSRIDCNFGLGTATYLTSVFGMAGASHIVRSLIK